MDFSSLTLPKITMSVWWDLASGWDGAKLESSTNGGGSWNRVGSVGDLYNWYNVSEGIGDSWGSSGNSGWVTASHVLSGLAGEANVILRVSFESDDGGSAEGFAFDDIVVEESPAADVGILSIDEPLQPVPANAAVEITVSIQNTGTDSQMNIPVSYAIDGGAPVNEIFPGPLDSLDSAQYTFTQTADLSVPGIYTLTAATGLAGDGFGLNDSNSIEIAVQLPIDTFPYLEDFETNANPWGVSSEGGQEVWELGTPVQDVINVAASGVTSWMTLLNSDPSFSNQYFVQSPAFDFSEMRVPVVSMSIWWELASGWDGATMESSIDGGGSWSTIGNQGQGENWFNDGDQWTGTIDDGDGSGGWLTAVHSLDELAGESSVILRVSAFGGGPGSGGYNGFAFDDVEIREGESSIVRSKSVAITNDLDGDGRADPGDTLLYTIDIVNDSVNDISGVLLNDTPEANAPLVAGSVMTSQGLVSIGNADIDTNVEVDLGLINSLGGTAQVSFEVQVLPELASSVEVVCNQAEITFDEQPNTTLLSDDEDIDGSEDETCISAFVDTDDDGIPDSTDACPGFDDSLDGDMDVVPDDCDVCLLGDDSADVDSDDIPDACDDSDGDGVSDAEELADGSDYTDPSSQLFSLATEFCVDWNGFIGQKFNIAEFTNFTSTSRDIAVTLYSLTGAAESSTNVPVLPGAQTDLLVHDMQGWSADSIGTLCADLGAEGMSGDVDGRMLHYKPDGQGSFDYVISMPFANKVTGPVFVQYNTFHPSLDPLDLGFFAANWFTIANDEANNQTGVVIIYGQDGTELLNEARFIPANGRIDVSVHDFGVNIIGLIEWRPDDNTAGFRVTKNRYVYDGATPAADVVEAVSMQAVRGSAQTIIAPVDTRGLTAVLEISNTAGAASNINVSVNGSSGVEVLNTTITLPAKGSHHIVLDADLVNDLGLARITVAAGGQVVVNAMQYGRSPTAGLENMYPVPAREALGTVMQGSYNTFLEQGCSLLLGNVSGADEMVSLDVTRLDGTVIVTGQSETVPANGIFEFDLCSIEEDDKFGVVRVTPTNSNTVVGNVVRLGVADNYRIATPVR